MPESLLTLMNSMPCFDELSDAAKHALAESGIRRHYKRGTYIWKVGDPAEFFAVINHGMIEINRYVTNSDGEVCMGFFGPCDAIGISAFTKKSNYPGEAKALTPNTEIIKFFPRARLQKKDDPVGTELQTWLHEMLLRHEQTLRDKIDILSAGSLESRIFEFLSHLRRRFGAPISRSGVRIPIELTRSQVGKMVDGRVESIIRILSRWQKQDLLNWSKNGIDIPNLDLLEKATQRKK